MHRHSYAHKPQSVDTAQAQSSGAPELSRSIEVTGDSYVAIGTFSSIWLGKFKPHINRPEVLALKAFNGSQLPENQDKILARVERESVSWHRVKHPNVLHLIGICKVRVGGIADSPLLVFPYCQRGTIMEFLERHPNANKLSLVHQILGGLEYLHSRRIVHGDIKGENILIKDDGQACLADYGQYRLINITENNKLLYNSAHWIAPEVINAPDNDHLPMTTQSDVWSFGMTVLEILSGARPWGDVRDFKVLQLVAGGEKPDRRDYQAVSRTVWDAIAPCWVGDPRGRPSIREIAI